MLELSTIMLEPSELVNVINVEYFAYIAVTLISFKRNELKNKMALLANIVVMMRALEYYVFCLTTIFCTFMCDQIFYSDRHYSCLVMIFISRILK